MKADLTDVDSSKSSSLVPPRRTSARNAQKRLLNTSSSRISSPSESENAIAIEDPVPMSEPIKKRKRIPTISKLELEILNQLSTKERSQKPATPQTDVDTSEQLPGRKARGRKPTVSQLESEIMEQLSSKNKFDYGNNSRSVEACMFVSPSLVHSAPQKNGCQSGIPEIQSHEEVKQQEETVGAKTSKAISRETDENSEIVKTPKKRGRKPKSIEDYLHSTSNGNSTSIKKETAETTNVSSKLKKLVLVTCGVCKIQVVESNFTYHRYSNHMGLARLEGESQEFSEAEKKLEMKRTLDKVKRLTCPICSNNFTTVPGFLYHQERCGVNPADLKNMQTECTICGRRVMALKVHMKIHEREEERKAEELRIKVEESNVKDTPLSKRTGHNGKTPRRVAAMKATSLFKEINEQCTGAENTPSKALSSKAAKLFVEPTGSKVTNSIIGAWKRQMAKDNGIAKCRYPACDFKSDCLDQLKQHHIKCEIGLKLKMFSCLSCQFQCTQRDEMVDHVIGMHVSEKDATFEVGSEPSDAGEEYDEDEEEIEVSDGDIEEKTPRQNSAPPKLKHTDKIYGITPSQLHQFKNLQTPQWIPQWLAEFHKKNYSNSNVFDDWQPTFERIENISDYSPSNVESLPFARRKINASNLHPEIKTITYEKLNLFEAKLHNGTPMFFCGGSIHSVAWCPTPVETSTNRVELDQYLAVSAFNEEDRLKSATHSSFSSKYVIQIWNCGKLRNQESPTVLPTLELCIAHDFGRMWSLVWCPSGCYNDARLGLLAAACSDGSVRLFSIPNPSVLQLKESGPLVLKAEPSISLSLNVQEKSECTSLHWDETKGHRFIVGGFANGTVALWNLEIQSPLLLNDKVLHPVWSFYGHSSVVTGVSLSPHHNDARFIATSSADRSVKLWDRFDGAMPVCWSKRSRVTDIKWRRHWPGVLVCVEDVCAVFRSTTMFYDFGYTGNRQALMPQNSVVWCAAENEYLDLLVHGTTAGEVVIYSSHFAVMDCDDKKLRKSRHIIFRTDLIDSNATGNESVVNSMKKSYLQSTKKVSRSRTELRQLPTSYSLIFNDITTVRSLGKQPPTKNISSDMMDIILPCDDQATSINKVLFNPNHQSHCWMCICGENGITQLLRIDSSYLSRVTDTYLKEMTV